MHGEEGREQRLHENTLVAALISRDQGILEMSKGFSRKTVFFRIDSFVSLIEIGKLRRGLMLDPARAKITLERRLALGKNHLPDIDALLPL